MEQSQQKECVDTLLALQHEDGGWGIAQLGTWDAAIRARKTRLPATVMAPASSYSSPAAPRVPASDPRLVRGVEWLKAHQRQSGRWFTRSLFCDRAHYISNAGTSFAVMALAECDALER